MVILWTNNEFIPQQWWVDVGFVSSMWDNLGHVWLNLNRGVGLLFFWEILQPNIEWHIWSLELSLFCGLVLGGPPFEKKDAACRVQRGPYEIMNSSPVSKFQECNLQHLWVSKKKIQLMMGKPCSMVSEVDHLNWGILQMTTRVPGAGRVDAIWDVEFSGVPKREPLKS